MNAISPWATTAASSGTDAAANDSGQRVFMRSLATRDFGSEISQALPDVLTGLQGGRL